MVFLLCCDLSRDYILTKIYQHWIQLIPDVTEKKERNFFEARCFVFENVEFGNLSTTRAWHIRVQSLFSWTKTKNFIPRFVHSQSALRAEFDYSRLSCRELAKSKYNWQIVKLDSLENRETRASKRKFYSFLSAHGCTANIGTPCIRKWRKNNFFSEWKYLSIGFFLFNFFSKEKYRKFKEIVPKPSRVSRNAKFHWISH